MDNSSILENIIINKKMMLLNRKNFIPSTSNTTIETGSGAHKDNNANKYIRKRIDSIYTKKKCTSTQCFGMSSNFTLGNIKTTSLANRFHIYKSHTDGHAENVNFRKEDKEYYGENSIHANNKTRQESKSHIFHNKVKVNCENLERNQNESFNNLRGSCTLNKKSNILVKPNIFSKLNNNINRARNNDLEIEDESENDNNPTRDKKTSYKNPKSYNDNEMYNNNDLHQNQRYDDNDLHQNQRYDDNDLHQNQRYDNNDLHQNQRYDDNDVLDNHLFKIKTGGGKDLLKNNFIQQLKNKNTKTQNVCNNLSTSKNIDTSSNINEKNMNINTPLFILKSHTSNTSNFIKDNFECPVIYDPDLFENEINKSQLKKFTQIYCYKDIKFYFNLYQEYRKSKVVEIISYWMGILDGPINSEYDEFDIQRLLENDIFIHNLKFCLILFVYNSNIEALVRQKINFPLLVYNLKKFSYFTNDTDLLFDWNEKLELFTVGYEFDIVHFIEEVPKYFLKHWILFENDFPLNLSDFCVERYGNNWTDVIYKKYNVNVKFLNNENMEQRRNAYETLFKLYKQCIYYISYTKDNIEKNKSNWYYECFLNGTPILTTDDNEFGFYDYYDNIYNLVFIDEITWNFTNYTNCTYSEYIRNLFNTKNIQKMSSLIYKMRTNLIEHKVNVVDYFKFIHFTIFKLNKVKNNNNVLNELIVL
jgi:hypothetical protein